MQLIVNGSQTHVLQVAPEANVAQLRAQLSMLEGVDCEQVNKFIMFKFNECNLYDINCFSSTSSAPALLLRMRSMSLLWRT